MAGQSEVRDLPTSVGILAVSARALHATSLCEGYHKEAITNTVVPHLVLLDNMLSAAACYGSQCYFIFQSLFY